MMRIEKGSVQKWGNYTINFPCYDGDYNGFYTYIYIHIYIMEYCLENHDKPLDSQLNSGDNGVIIEILYYSWTSVEGLITLGTSQNCMHAGNVTLARSIQNMKTQFHSY